MIETLVAGWDNKECGGQIATSVMNYRLSQEVFSFDARITIRVKAVKRIVPSGF